ncbi:hypothetical protein [Sphingopyxis sp.]|uniref:hypothetical protein n=1 Tax=Sphingopyxis sp. TaxID=1908224 RepID=UPI002D79220B|nr:hypothetical protein [Sphingopyxis sp.]HET6525036.1 hypothetical protein [Sphingopyxis sp.]
MAEHYLEASFSFTCTDGEMALLKEIFEAASDMMGDIVPPAPSPKILEFFPPENDDDPWSGLCAIFCDADFPDFGARIEAGTVSIDGAGQIAHIHGTPSFQPDPVAMVIHRCCAESLLRGPIGFEWSESCSKPREGEFGGGWCAIFADRIEMHSTREALSAALGPLVSGNPPHSASDAWAERPGHPLADWKYQIANDDTRLGYRDWIAAREVAELHDTAGYPDATSPVPEAPGLYLHLYHGRKDPHENLEDWGSEGPVIGPLAYLHTTYMCDVKFAAAPDVMECFFPAVMTEWRARGLSNVAGPLCDWRLTVFNDYIEYDGIYYGDWTVFVATPGEVDERFAKTAAPA